MISNFPLKGTTQLLGRRLILGQGKYRMSLEHLIARKKQEAVKDHWGHVRMTLMPRNSLPLTRNRTVSTSVRIRTAVD